MSYMPKLCKYNDPTKKQSQKLQHQSRTANKLMNSLDAVRILTTTGKITLDTVVQKNCFNFTKTQTWAQQIKDNDKTLSEYTKALIKEIKRNRP